MSQTVRVGIASVLGSFVVYAGHVACVGGAIRRGVVSAPAQMVSPVAQVATAGGAAPTAVAVPSVDACGCAMPRISASFVVSGDEKIALDPVDSSATLDVEYGRAPSGTTIVTLHAVVRAYRTDIPSERPTTFAIRVTLPEGATEPTSARDLEAYLTTWGSAHGGGVTTGGKHLAPRSYATVSKSALTWSTNAVALEIRGSITLKDVPTGKSVTLEKLTIRKTGDALLPVRSGPFHAP